MPVTVKLPTQLRDAAGGQASASIEGAATVGEVLGALYEQHSELRTRIADEEGQPRRFVNVYLGGEDIRFLDGLATAVPDGAEVTILPAVAGGQGQPASAPDAGHSPALVRPLVICSGGSRLRR